MADDEHVLWERAAWQCVMVSCCAGAELQLRRFSPPVSSTSARDFEIVVRELYPTKSDLYERARALDVEYGSIISQSAVRR
jgi:hypothetical protein